jgi:hypothetical protein
MGAGGLESLISDNQNAVGAYAQDTVDIVKDLLRPGDRLVMTVVASAGTGSATTSTIGAAPALSRMHRASAPSAAPTR